MNICIPSDVRAEAEEANGKFAEKISGIPASKIVDDMFNVQRAVEQLELLRRFLPDRALAGKKMLELGSGAGLLHFVAQCSLWDGNMGTRTGSQ